MLILKILFWVSLFLLLYPYIIYPIVLSVLAKLFPKNRQVQTHDNEFPEISFIISAFNEEKVIEEKIENTLSIDYPQDKITVLVISDASDDQTDNIVNRWSEKDSRIKLVRQNERKGKTAGLNLAMRDIHTELVIFTDANSMYRTDALHELVKYFADPAVGYVVGAALYNEDDSSGASQSEGLYWNYELTLKQKESDFHSVVGGDGAIYAIRRELFKELREDDINDFVNPLQIVAAGYRGLFNPKAICYEDTAENFSKEFNRKRRIVNRSWRAFTRNIGQFKPLRDARFLFELISHKVIRWFSMLFIVLMSLCSLVLTVSQSGGIYTLALAGLLCITCLAVYGRHLDRQGKAMHKLIYIPYYFYLVNIAALLGIVDNTLGVKHVTWSHVRSEQKTD